MVIADNRKARFDYEIVQTLEAGIVLEGWEVKSLRAKNVNLRSAWVSVKNGEAYLKNCKIAIWRYGSEAEQNPLRERKLLLHKNEALKLERQIIEKKVSVIPLKLYISKGKIKCELAVGKGRKRYEKKQVLKERSMQREIQKAMKKW